MLIEIDHELNGKSYNKPTVPLEAKDKWRVHYTISESSPKQLVKQIQHLRQQMMEATLEQDTENAKPSWIVRLLRELSRRGREELQTVKRQ